MGNDYRDDRFYCDIYRRDGVEMIDVYLHRNLVVAKAEGIKAGIAAALTRLACSKNRPKWLFELLGREYAKTDGVIKELVKHRDEFYVKEKS
jgi:hypothetical protein